jgi:acyl carrier protein
MNTMLTKEQITAVQGILMDQLDIKAEQITLDARLEEELGADSLDKVEIAMKTDEQFGITIPDEALERIVTVEDIYDVLAEQLGQKA